MLSFAPGYQLASLEIITSTQRSVPSNPKQGLSYLLCRSVFGCSFTSSESLNQKALHLHLTVYSGSDLPQETDENCSVYSSQMPYKSLTSGGRNWPYVRQFAGCTVRHSFNETFLIQTEKQAEHLLLSVENGFTMEDCAAVPTRQVC